MYYHAECYRVISWVKHLIHSVTIKNLPILSLIDSYDILITVLLASPTWETAFVLVCVNSISYGQIQMKVSGSRTPCFEILNFHDFL